MSKGLGYRPIACSLCERIGQPVAFWPIGPVCRSCYIRARAQPADCGACGQLRVLIAPANTTDPSASAGRDICGSCAGSRHTYLCGQCGGGEEPYKDGECVRCAARRMLTEDFSGPEGQLCQQARLVVEAMAASRRPRSVLQWRTNPRGGALILRETFTRGCEVTHEMLDDIDNKQAWSLRRTLVDVGALPERDEALAVLRARVRQISDDAPHHHRNVLLTYGNWWLLRRGQRRRERTGRFTQGQIRTAVGAMLSAAVLLTWLDRQQLALSTLSQPDLERWIEGYPSAHRAADFLRWTHRRRLTDRLTIAPRPRSDPHVFLGEEHRWELLTQCLNNPQLPTDVRAAGALVLLYGIPLTRIVELTREHLDAPDTGTARGLRVDLTWPVVTVPPALGRLLATLPAGADPRGATLIPTGEPSGWLFPGRTLQRHIDAASLARRLRIHGVTAKAARNSALIALAADLPTTVLMDLFGLSAPAAVRWTRHAGRSWHAYIAATAANRRATP